MLKLNLGAGEFKLPEYINIDCESSTEPDLLLDFTREPLPYEKGQVDEVKMIHCLEHVEYFHWGFLLGEISRVLKPNGILMLSYPEFGECAKRFLANDNEQKHFWQNTLYGRQLYPSDYHVVPMHSKYIKEVLETAGFYRVHYQPESEHSPYNTILIARRDPSPVSRESVLVKEMGLAIK